MDDGVVWWLVVLCVVVELFDSIASLRKAKLDYLRDRVLFPADCDCRRSSILV
jgi:hypothetical protein